MVYLYSEHFNKRYVFYTNIPVYDIPSFWISQFVISSLWIFSECQVQQQNPPPVQASDLDTSFPDQAGSAAACQDHSNYDDIKSLTQLQRLVGFDLE